MRESRAEFRGKRAEARGTRWILLALTLFLPSAVIPLPSASAQPTQDEVLRSIESQVGAKVDSEKLLAFGLIVVAGIGILVYINHARNRQVIAKPLNSPGKLVKEIARTMNLKSSELRQLRTLGDRLQVMNPIVLLLCPSLLARAVHENPDVADRGILTSLARKTVAKEA